MDRRYFSCAALASYDDSEPPADSGRAFSQEEVNRLLADDRRKHQARIDRVQRTLEEVSASKNLSVKEREQLATQLEAMAAENRTREEQLVHERTQLEKQHAQVLADEKKNTDAWRKRFEDSAIQNALVDASHRSDAFSTDQILRLLRPSTRVVERADERARGLATMMSSSIFPTPMSRVIRPPARYLRTTHWRRCRRSRLTATSSNRTPLAGSLQARGPASRRAVRSTFAI